MIASWLSHPRRGVIWLLWYNIRDMGEVEAFFVVYFYNNTASTTNSSNNSRQKRGSSSSSWGTFWIWYTQSKSTAIRVHICKARMNEYKILMSSWKRMKIFSSSAGSFVYFPFYYFLSWRFGLSGSGCAARFS